MLDIERLTETQIDAEIAHLKDKLREKKATPLDADRLIDLRRALDRIRAARSESPWYVTSGRTE